MYHFFFECKILLSLKTSDILVGCLVFCYRSACMFISSSLMKRYVMPHHHHPYPYPTPGISGKTFSTKMRCWWQQLTSLPSPPSPQPLTAHAHLQRGASLDAQMNTKWVAGPVGVAGSSSTASKSDTKSWPIGR